MNKDSKLRKLIREAIIEKVLTKRMQYHDMMLHDISRDIRIIMKESRTNIDMAVDMWVLDSLPNSESKIRARKKMALKAIQRYPIATS